MQAAVADAGTIARSKALDDSLARAHQLAVAQNHPTVALEHLLFAIQDDPDGQAILISSGVGRDRLAADVSAYLGRLSETATPRTGSSPQPGPDLLRILQLAAMAARQSQRRSIDGAIVLAAIIGDGNSPAAGMLKAQGLTFDAVIKALTQTAPARQSELPAAPARASLPAPPDAGAETTAPSPPQPQAPTRAPRELAMPSAEEALATARARVKQSEPQSISIKPSRPPGGHETEPAPSPVLPRPALPGASAAPAVAVDRASGLATAVNSQFSASTAAPAISLEIAPSSMTPVMAEANVPPLGPPPSSAGHSPLSAAATRVAMPPPTAAVASPGLSTLQPSGAGAALPPLPAHRSPHRPPLPPTATAPPTMPPAAPPPSVAAPPSMGLSPVAQRPLSPPQPQPQGVPGTVSAYSTLSQAPPHSSPHSPPPPLPPPVVAYAPPPVAAAPQPMPPVTLPPQAFGPSLVLDIVAAAAGLPATMRLGVPVLVEIRVPRDQIDVPRRRGPHALGGGAETPIYRVVSLRLGTGGVSGLAIEPRSPETIWIGMGRDFDAHEFIWQFVVTPTRPGRFAVTLAVSGRTVSPYGVSGDDTPQSETFAVVVKRVTGGRTKRFLWALGLMAVGAAAALLAGGPAISFAKTALAHLLK